MLLLSRNFTFKKILKQSSWLAVTLVVLVLDQFSKFWAIHHLVPYEALALSPMLNLTLAFNTGAAFSFLSQAGAWHLTFFMIFGLVMSLILVVLMFRTAWSQKLQLAALSLILGGALGNSVDRLTHGFVIDFIDLYYQNHHWYIFNLADSAICLGAIILIFHKLEFKSI